MQTQYRGFVKTSKKVWKTILFQDNQDHILHQHVYIFAKGGRNIYIQIISDEGIIKLCSNATTKFSSGGHILYEPDEGYRRTCTCTIAGKATKTIREYNQNSGKVCTNSILYVNGDTVSRENTCYIIYDMTVAENSNNTRTNITLELKNSAYPNRLWISFNGRFFSSFSVPGRSTMKLSRPGHNIPWLNQLNV